MMRKIDVNGPKTDPLYAWLKRSKKGLLGSEGIKWNFTKFLIDRSGEVVARFAPTDTPQSLEGAIEALL
jgi:glutathione peroxidase